MMEDMSEGMCQPLDVLSYISYLLNLGKTEDEVRDLVSGASC